MPEGGEELPCMSGGKAGLGTKATGNNGFLADPGGCVSESGYGLLVTAGVC